MSAHVILLFKDTSDAEILATRACREINSVNNSAIPVLNLNSLNGIV
ncbi:hypothetical protein MNBD_GAMMA22-1256 [hydrothermal vent metagenome]|uniref:Uncharacterized protein n=1 Tax=hydrothermal vent metagenome TaxID=652676 RepID=A0A3B0ZU09_9ZZZZ